MIECTLAVMQFEVHRGVRSARALNLPLRGDEVGPPSTVAPSGEEIPW